MYFLVYDFSSFHHNSFRDTISWERVIKDDCVRSCLIEFQSFPLSKFYVDPIHRVLMYFLLFSACTMQVVVLPGQFFWILVFFVPWIHRREEYCLSFAQILSSRKQSRKRDGVDCTSDVIIVLEEIVRS